MTGSFDYFVIFAEMRTGSNFLEENLNDYPGIQCFGEVFNPHFIGRANQKEMLGVSLKAREANPIFLFNLLREKSDGLAGFRFFHDHDPRILDACLDDPRCGKIILTRNPVDTYISREIARQTNQWRLQDMKTAKTAKVKFNQEEFDAHLARHQGFQQKLQTALQTSGQTAFYIGYDDITDLKVLNGLARFLGVDAPKDKVSKATKKQNPQPLEEKVSNFEQMETGLASIDHFSLNETPNFEPRRGAAVPGYIAAAHAPVLFMPIPSGPTEMIVKWLAELDGVEDQELIRGFTQKTLRQWKRKSKGHQSFSVVRHPVARLHHAFVTRILMPGPNAFTAIRDTLREAYDLPIPEGDIPETYDSDAHRTAFIAFAQFIKGNLGGQTAIRVDTSWASQSEILGGFGNFMSPNHVFRETDLASDLQYLADKTGLTAPGLELAEYQSPISLTDIYNPDVEAAVRAAYQRDYMMFGFGPWQA